MRTAAKYLAASLLSCVCLALLLTPGHQIQAQPGVTIPSAATWTITAANKVDAANTNFNGSGTLTYIGKVETRAWLDRIEWQSLGTNAACVGTVYVEQDDDIGTEVEHAAVRSRTLAATTSSTTAAISTISVPVGRWVAPGTRFHASVTVDLTGSAGYSVSAVLGDHPSEF